MEFCRARSTDNQGPTAHEPSPPRAPGQIKVWYRDIARDVRGRGNRLGACLLMEFGGAAIGKIKACGGLGLCGKPVTQQQHSGQRGRGRAARQIVQKPT